MASLVETIHVRPGLSARLWTFARRNPTIVLGGALLAAMAAIALVAPMIAGDPRLMTPTNRLRTPSAEHWFGTDNLGRDVFSRVILGSRAALAVALLVVAGSMVIGVPL